MDKQNRILDAALKEFAENGFEKASTNQIVKNAGIGKGMLFYYFENKEGLYHYLIDYCLDFTEEEFIKRIDTNEPDFIERFKQIAQLKIEYHLKHPHVFNFLGGFFLLEESQVPEKFKQRYLEMMGQSHSMLYENIDKTLFRNDVDTDKAFKLIQWSIEGYQNELVSQFKHQNFATMNLDPYWDEFYQYLDVLKTVYYLKEEGKR